MAVILYQIGIFIAMQIAANFGRNSRNTALVLISIFTILQVFMSWLLLLQFITIYIAYAYSETIIDENNNNKIQHKKSENYGRSMQSLPVTKTDTTHYGTDVNNPILMSSIPSSRRFLDKIIMENDNLTYSRTGSTKTNLFNNPIDIYEFYENEKYLLKIYVYPYYNSNIEIIPEKLKKRKMLTEQELKNFDFDSLFDK